MSCIICTGNLIKPVTCAKCNGCSCKACFQAYLLNSTLTPTCMHCREPLSDDFLVDNTSPSWSHSKYKQYKEQLLYETERARLPETQPFAEAYVNAKTIMEPVAKEIAELQVVYSTNKRLVKAIDELRWERWNDFIFLEAQVPGYKTKTPHELAKIRSDSSRLRSKAKLRLTELHAVERIYLPIVLTFGKSVDQVAPTRVKRVLVKACPKDGCNAFLNEDFNCGLCASSVCKKCHEILQPVENGEHMCNEDTVASIKAVQAEARPCPSCATLISKIDGCDQMWCTQCKTSFSWRTGLVETGVTHNPHYYEWMRRNGGLPRAPGDIPGGGCNAFPLIGEILQSKPDIAEQVRLCRIHALIHANSTVDGELLQYLLLTNYHAVLQHTHAHNNHPIARPDNFVLRVKHLTNTLDEQQFKVLLQRADKAYRKNVAKKHVYDMAYAAAGDILRNCMAGVSFQETVTHIESLLKYSNTALERIEKAYSCIASKYVIHEIVDAHRESKTWFDRRY
jgi:hypothetical protein